MILEERVGLVVAVLYPMLFIWAMGDMAISGFLYNQPARMWIGLGMLGWFIGIPIVILLVGWIVDRIRASS